MSTSYRAPRIKLAFEADTDLIKVPDRVQLLRTGVFHDDRYGQVNITKETLSSMKKNFDEKVRRVDLAIDYSHESQDKAAGWITGLELLSEGEELWAFVKWTPAASTMLAAGEYRYLSADFMDNYIDNESLKEFGPTLLGAGLTNRPVVKDMEPAVQLTEGGTSMAVSEKEHNDLKKSFDELSTKYADLKKQCDELLSSKGGKSGDDGDEDDQANKKKMTELADENQKLKDKIALSEKTAKFEKMMSEGKAVEAQRESFLKDDVIKFAELGEKPNLKAHGHGGGGSENVSLEHKTVADQVIDEAKKLCDEKKAKDMGDAISMVLKGNKELAKKYSEAK